MSVREADVRIHHLDLLTISGELGRASDHQRVLINSTEQALIHLLDRKVLLNSQPGGYFRSYVPDEQTQPFINQLSLDAVKNYFFVVAMGNQEQCDTIKIHFNTLRQSLQGMNTADSKRLASMLGNQYIDFLARQASGGLSIGVNVMPFMIFATDITYSDFRNQDRFFDESRAVG